MMDTGLAVTEVEINQILAGSPFAAIYKFKLQSLGKGECILRMPFQESLERPGGIVAGWALMAVADVSTWLAIMTLIGKDSLTVTTDLNTKFLSSAIREEVECTARILKTGKGLIYGVAECRRCSGKLLTHHTVTYVRVSDRARSSV